MNIPKFCPLLAWNTLNEQSLYTGLNPEMRARIESVIESCLPLCAEHKDEHQWNLLFEDKDGVTSHLRNTEDGRTMIKSVSILDHHVKQVFNLVVDIEKRRHFETNVRSDKRLQTCNHHTYIDYYAYQAVWPTSARDFVVLLHWRILERNQSEKAILIFGVSYPEADDLFPTPSDHVRGELGLSMYLLRPVDGNKCHMTRLLSYDLMGSIPKRMTKTILQQQATLPHDIRKYLSKTEPNPPSHLKGGDIENEILIRDIINLLPHD